VRATTNGEGRQAIARGGGGGEGGGGEGDGGGGGREGRKDGERTGEEETESGKRNEHVPFSWGPSRRSIPKNALESLPFLSR